MSSFHNGGPKAAVKAYQAEHQAIIDSLHEKLAGCASEEDRQRIQEQIKAEQQKHQAKLKKLDRSLF